MKHSAMPPLPEKMEPYPKPSPLKTPQEVSARIREYISNVRKVLRKDGTTMRLDMTDAMVKRRSDVLLRTLDTVEQRYGDMPGFGTDDPNAVMEDWLYINWLPDTTYNSMELHNHLLYAASMWMLDRIMEKDGAHWDINRWLPRNDHILDGMNVPNTWDCCHEDDLIMSVMWVVCHRNDDAGPEQTDAYRVPYVLAGDLTAEGLQQQDVPSRRNFEGLLKMIPEEYKQRACDHFREAFWKWSDRYFAGLSALHEELPVNAGNSMRSSPRLTAPGRNCGRPPSICAGKSKAVPRNKRKMENRHSIPCWPVPSRKATPAEPLSFSGNLIRKQPSH